MLAAPVLAVVAVVVDVGIHWVLALALGDFVVARSLSRITTPRAEVCSSGVGRDDVGFVKR